MMKRKLAGSIIKSNRETKNITLRGLANDLDVSYTHLSNIENGSRRPSYELLFNICKILNIDPILLFHKYDFFNNPSQQDLKAFDDLFSKHNIDWRDDNNNYVLRENFHHRIEDFIQHNSNIYVNNSLLSSEEKNILLQIIKLTFHYKNDNNYPTLEEVKSEFENNTVNNLLSFGSDNNDTKD